MTVFVSLTHAEIRYSSVVRNADGTVIVNDPVYAMPDGSTPSIKLVVMAFNQNSYKRSWIYTEGARAICRIVARLPNPKVEWSRNSVFIQQVVLGADGQFQRYTEREFGSSENAYTSDAVTCSR